MNGPRLSLKFPYHWNFLPREYSIIRLIFIYSRSSDKFQAQEKACAYCTWPTDHIPALISRSSRLTTQRYIQHRSHLKSERAFHLPGQAQLWSTQKESRTRSPNRTAVIKSLETKVPGKAPLGYHSTSFRSYPLDLLESLSARWRSCFFYFLDRLLEIFAITPCRSL